MPRGSLPPAIIPSLPPAGSLFLHEPSCLYEGRRRFRRFFLAPASFSLFQGSMKTVSLPKAWENTGQAIVRGSFMRRTRNAISPSYIMPALLFHPDPKTAGPLPSPISIPAVPASLYLLYFPSYWHMPRLLSLLSILHFFSSGAGLAFPCRENFFASFFSTVPWCAPLFPFLSRTARPCTSPSRKFLCFFLFNRPLGVLHCFPFLSVLPGFVFPVAKVSLLLSFQPPLRCAPLFPFSLFCPALYSPVAKVSLLLSFQKKRALSQEPLSRVSSFLFHGLTGEIPGALHISSNPARPASPAGPLPRMHPHKRRRYLPAGGAESDREFPPRSPRKRHAPAPKHWFPFRPQIENFQAAGMRLQIAKRLFIAPPPDP